MRKLLIGLLTSSAVFVGVQAEAFQGEFTFKGSKFGDSINQVMANSISPASHNLCSQLLRGQGKSYCFDSNSNLPNMNSYKTFITYYFWNGHLSGISITFDNADYAALEGMLIGKYGEPDEKKVEAVSTHFGLAQNPVAVWHTPNGDMTLKFYGSSMKEGLLSIDDEALKKESDASEKAQFQKSGQDAFADNAHQQAIQKVGDVGLKIIEKGHRKIVESVDSSNFSSALYLKPGDEILTIEYKAARKLSLEAFNALLKGVPGTPVTIMAIHSGGRREVHILIRK